MKYTESDAKLVIEDITSLDNNTCEKCIFIYGEDCPRSDVDNILKCISVPIEKSRKLEKEGYYVLSINYILKQL